MRHCLKLVSIKRVGVKRPISLLTYLYKLIYDIYGYSSDEDETQLEKDGNGYPSIESVEDTNKDNPKSLHSENDKSLEVDVYQQQGKTTR